MLLRTLGSSLILLALSLTGATAAWRSERDPEIGFTFSYPSELFEQTEGDGKPFFHYFASEDSEAKFLVGGWDNSAGQFGRHRRFDFAVDRFDPAPFVRLYDLDWR